MCVWRVWPGRRVCWSRESRLTHGAILGQITLRLILILMAFTFNGIGTKFYGQRDFRTDGSYITTEWVVFLYVPLNTFRSLRVGYLGRGDQGWSVGVASSASERYVVYEKHLPNWKQVLSIWGYLAFVVGWVYLVARVALAVSPRAFDHLTGIYSVLVAFMMAIPIPWLLRSSARRKVIAPSADAAPGKSIPAVSMQVRRK